MYVFVCDCRGCAGARAQAYRFAAGGPVIRCTINFSKDLLLYKPKISMCNFTHKAKEKILYFFLKVINSKLMLFLKLVLYQRNM